MKDIEYENNNLKNDLINKNKNIEEYKLICKKNELQMETLNKTILKLQEELVQSKLENNDYKTIENTKVNNKLLYEFTKFNFDINPNKKKLLLYSFSKMNFNIISDEKK